jgi:hypothetical protein
MNEKRSSIRPSQPSPSRPPWRCRRARGIAISLRKAIAEDKLPAGYNVKYDGQIKTLSAGAEEEAARARVVNG